MLPGSYINFIRFQSPLWGVSKESDVPKVLFMFQSPQWGCNSKEKVGIGVKITDEFQSPRWG